MRRSTFCPLCGREHLMAVRMSEISVGVFRVSIEVNEHECQRVYAEIQEVIDDARRKVQRTRSGIVIREEGARPGVGDGTSANATDDYPADENQGTEKNF